MAHKVLDRTKETATTSGTGAFTLAGASPGFVSFSSQLADNDTTWYCAVNDTQWEIGLGTRSAAGVLARTSIERNSNGDTNAVNFTAPPLVFSTVPASKMPTGTPSFTYVRRNAAQSIANVTEVVISHDTEVSDTPNAWAIGTPTKIIVPAGKTLAKASAGVAWASNGTNARDVYIKLGTTYLQTDTRRAVSGSVGSLVTPTVAVSAGQEFTLAVFQDSGAALNVTWAWLQVEFF